MVNRDRRHTTRLTRLVHERILRRKTDFEFILGRSAMAASKDKSPDSGPVFAGERTKERSAARVQRASTIAPFGYLTPEAEFGDVERGNPLPYTLDLTRRREVGLERETWQLEVIADPDSNAKIEQPLSNELGTALDFKALVQLGQAHGVPLVALDRHRHQHFAGRVDRDRPLLPGPALVRGLPQIVVREVEGARIHGRERERLSPNRAI